MASKKAAPAAATGGKKLSKSQVIGSLAEKTGLAKKEVGGVFGALTVPGATGDTYAFDITDDGRVLGYYQNGATNQGFLATPTTVPEPGTLGLLAVGLASVPVVDGEELDRRPPDLHVAVDLGDVVLSGGHSHTTLPRLLDRWIRRKVRNDRDSSAERLAG